MFSTKTTVSTSAATPPHRLRTNAHTGDRNRPRRIPLPDGVWLNPRDHNYAILYGSTFVIQRDRVGGPGLVRTNRDWDMIQVWTPPAPTDLVTRDQPGQLQPFASVTLDVDFVDVLPPEVDGESPPECASCTALVFAGSSRSDCDSEVGNSLNPRRTKKMQFTCNRCGTRNTNFVNPHAWKNGAVFCRCKGCSIVHLIRDEKRIFWVPPAASQDDGLRIPDGLVQLPEVPGGAVSGEEVL